MSGGDAEAEHFRERGRAAGAEARRPAQSPGAIAANLWRVPALAFFQVFLVIMPLAVPVFSSRGLDMSGILQLQALFGLTVVAAEVPSGYLADVLGRRRTLVAGTLWIGVGHTLLLFAHDFATLAAFEIALGIGMSLVSGADVALLYDSARAVELPAERRQRLLGNLFFVRSVAEALAAVLASVLVLASLEAVVVCQVAVGWLPLAFALGLREPPGERGPAGGHLADLAQVLLGLLANGPVLRLTFLAMGVWSLTTFYAAWLIQQNWLEQGIALGWYGLIWAAFQLTAGVAGRQAGALERRLGAPALLLAAGLLPALAYAGVAVAGPAFGVLIAGAFFVARGAGFVLLQEALNRRLDGRRRATANSLASFVARGGFALTLPLVTWLLETGTLARTFAWLGVASAVVFAALMVPLAWHVRALGRAVPVRSAS